MQNWAAEITELMLITRVFLQLIMPDIKYMLCNYKNFENLKNLIKLLFHLNKFRNAIVNFKILKINFVKCLQ